MADLDPRAPLFIANTSPSSGPKIGVLLSHGFTGSPASMRPWGEFLAQHGYTVSVPRLPGHGTTVEEMLQTRYSDYTAAIESAYADLAAQCDAVVVAGLSMGGALVLQLAERHPEIAGVVVVNPAVASTNKQLLLLPLIKYLVKTFPAIGNDIKKADTNEYGYDKTPLKPLASMIQTWKQIRADLGLISCPVLLFRSAEDHVVDPSSARIILGGIASQDTAEVVLANSFHVATLDNDAPEIFATSADFIKRVTADV
ncbi:MAG: alpha/beta hydrolase [Marmoricola sp.]